MNGRLHCRMLREGLALRCEQRRDGMERGVVSARRGAVEVAAGDEQLCTHEDVDVAVGPGVAARLGSVRHDAAETAAIGCGKPPLDFTQSVSRFTNVLPAAG